MKKISGLKNQKILIRCDFDVPLKNGEILDHKRLDVLVPTIEYFVKLGCKVVLIGHLGRPDGRVVSELSLEPVRMELERLLSRSKEIKKYRNKGANDFEIKLIPIERYVGVKAKKAVDEMKAGEIVMLENLRFSDREEKNCRKFAKKLAELGDVYVNEAFAVSHRAHASVSAIQNYLPSYMGFHFSEEIKHLTAVRDHAKKPLVVIIGGAKVETKLPVIEKFLDKADYILIGGMVANTFLKAAGVEIGKSFVDDEYLGVAMKILGKVKTLNSKLQINFKFQILNSKLVLPVDVKLKSGVTCLAPDVKHEDMIFDIGPETIKIYTEIIKKAKTIIWNGPMGKFEEVEFKAGTEAVARTILKSKAQVVVGGGETNEIFANKKIPKNVWVSIGGGAMLEFLAGKKIVGAQLESL